MNLKICNWINTKSYYPDKTYSISFIENIKNNIYYILKGKMSDLWNIIVTTENYQKIVDFSIQNNMFNILSDFLSELQNLNIIQIDRQLPKKDIKYMKNRIHKDNAVYKYFLKLYSYFIIKNNFLTSLYFELNYKCNLRCKHCYNNKDDFKSEISFKDAKKIIDEALELGLGSVTITGGECTLNKDFLSIVRYIRKKHIALKILTNAQKLYEDEFLFENLVNIYPFAVQISLYSMKPNVHDYITGVKGSHHKTLSVIKKLKERNINTRIAFPLLSYNFESYEEVKSFSQDINAWSGLSCLFINNRKNNNSNTKLDLECAEKLYFKENIHQEAAPENSDGIICVAGFDALCISPKLEILPCVGVNYVLGNYNQNSLKELISTSVMEFREKYRRKNLTECYKYNYCKFCNHCLLVASHDRGIMKKSEFLCNDAKARYGAFLKSQLL